MSRLAIRSLYLSVVIFCVATTASADIKIKSKTTTGAQSITNTTLIKGPRTRASMGYGMDTIDQCDLNRAVVVNDKAKRYMIKERSGQTPAAPTSQSFGSDAMPNLKPEKAKKEIKKGVITYTTTIVDTGERKQILGYNARHLKVTTVAESTKDACSPVNLKMESDGWYIDLEVESGCSRDATTQQGSRTPASECGDEVIYKTNGEAKLGYAVQQTTTVAGPDGRPQVSSVDVIEISKESIDASLLDVPADYKQVNSFSELAGINVGSSDAMIDPSSLLEELGMNASGGMGGATIEPKKPGAIRIGVVSFQNKTDIKFLPPDLRDKLISAINGGTVEAVPLRGRNQSDIDADSKKKECDYVLLTDLVTIKKSTGGGMFGKVSKMANINAINDKYEAKVDYKLFAAGNSAPVASSSETANSGGGLNAFGALQGGLQLTSMFMGGGMMMNQMFMSRLQGMGSNMLMQQMMSGMTQGMGGTMDKKQEDVVVNALALEAKSVVGKVQKRQQ